MTDSPIKSPSAARRAGNLVKTAPEKIIEHALNTALNTVEKAAQTEVKRTAKRAEKTAKKLKKVQKIAKAAQSEAKRATYFSTTLGKMDKKTDTPSQTTRLKKKIKEIILPPKNAVFYYDRRQIMTLTLIYAVIACFVYLISTCLLSVQMYQSWVLTVVLMLTQLLTLLALASSVFVMIFPQKLATITADSIKIDHNRPLKWEDIELAEEKYTSFLTRRPFMALHLKTGALAKYRLTFMQILCQKNTFTPFSIPLYAMRPEDAANIRELIKRSAKYKDSRN